MYLQNTLAADKAVQRAASSFSTKRRPSKSSNQLNVLHAGVNAARAISAFGNKRPPKNRAITDNIFGMIEKAYEVQEMQSVSSHKSPRSPRSPRKN